MFCYDYQLLVVIVEIVVLRMENIRVIQAGVELKLSQLKFGQGVADRLLSQIFIAIVLAFYQVIAWRNLGYLSVILCEISVLRGSVWHFVVFSYED